MLARPPNTAASSVMELDTMVEGSLKWRDRCERK